MSSYARDECAGGPLLSIRVALVPAFHLGDDVVLLAMDGAGLEAFGAALDQARRQAFDVLLVDTAGRLARFSGGSNFSSTACAPR